MDVNNLTTMPVKPFNGQYKPLNHSTAPFYNNNFFIKNDDTKPLTNYTQINSLNLKEDFLAKFLPKNYIAKYLDTGFINKQINNNPKIKELLAKNGLNTNINQYNVIEIIDSHLIPTAFFANLIMKNSGICFSPEEYSLMNQAALLHDIGKIFIPQEILNKKNELTPKEREIIDLHDSLGVELLKNTKVPLPVLHLIENHHNHDEKAGNNILTQILKISDVYSALKENRAYKSAMSDEPTFKVLYEMAAKGEFDSKLVDVLKANVGNNTTSQKITVA